MRVGLARRAAGNAGDASSTSMATGSVASPTGVADRAARRRTARRPDHARAGQRPQPRLPPGPAGPDRVGPAARSGPGATRCTASRPRLDPGLLPAAGHGHLRRDGPGRHHDRGRVPLPPPPAGREAVRRSQRHGPRPRRGGRRRPACGSPCSTRATCTGASGGRRTTCSAASRDGSAEAWARTGRRARRLSATVRIGAAVHSVRAVDPAGMTAVGGVGGRAATSPLHAHRQRAAGRERATAGRPTDARRPSCWATRACWASASPPCTPPTSPTATSRSLGEIARAASARRPSGTWPTASARRPASSRPGAALCLGVGLPRRDRPLRGSAGGRAGRAAGPHRAAGTTRPRSCCGPPRPAGRTALGWTGGGRIEVGALADLTVIDVDARPLGRSRARPPRRGSGLRRRRGRRARRHGRRAVVGARRRARAGGGGRRAGRVDRGGVVGRERAAGRRRHRPARHERPRAR